MKITGIEVIRVFIPWKVSYKEPMRLWRKMQGTTPEEEDAYCIIQVHTDEGITGIGEGGRSVEKVRARAKEFVGKNPLEMDIHSLRPPWVHAMFDIAGKALGVPAYRLLGTKVRDVFSVKYWSPHQPPEITRQHAEEGAKLGFKLHKIKARPHDVVEQVKAIAGGGGPDYAIRIDPNCHFNTLAQTVKIDRALEGYNIECFEDPFPKGRMALYRLAREKCHIPITLHSQDLSLIMEAMRLDAIDYLNTGGSPEHVRKAAALAEANGVPIWIQFEGHCLDVAAAFDAHVGAVLPNLTLPADCSPFLRESGITKEGLPVVNGEIAVPQGPGLGVTLDEKLIAEYQVE